MLNLFRSRDKAVRILLGAVVVVMGFSMLTYLIPNYNSDGRSGNDLVVATIAGEAITLPEVQRMIQNTMRGRQLPPELLPTYVPTIVDNMVMDRALAYQAEKLGYEVTDEQLRTAIQRNIPSLFPDGKFVGKDSYAAMLAQQNISIAEFEEDMRRQMLVTRLRNVAMEGTLVTPTEIEQEYKKKNEKIKVQYVKLSSDKYKNEVQPTAEEMQTYFKANSARYTVPETRNLAILVADQVKIEQTVNPTDADLLRAYNRDQNQFRMPESVKVRHILFKTQGKPPADEPKIKAQAEDVLKQVKAGANFAELVKKYSEDTGSVANNGEYSGVVKGQMMPEFEQAAFSLKSGETSLVKTSYGYHIVQTLAHDQPRVKPFEEVKKDLADQWKKQRVNDLMQQASDRAEAALKKDPTHPEKAAADLNLDLVHANNVEPGKPLPELGVSPDFDSSIGSLKKGEVSQPVAFAGNKIALAVVTDVIPPRPNTFDEVKDKIREAMVQDRIVGVVQTHARELMDKAKSMGDLAKAAKSMGLEAKTSDEVTRSGAVEGLGSASYVQEGFSRPAGELFGPVPTPDATVVAKVIAHVDADLSKLPAERAAIRDEIKSQKARDRNALFESGLKDALIKDGKVKIHQDVVNRLIAGYKSS